MMEAFHLEGPAGRLFCVTWRPPAGQRIQFGVLCLSPFAEEAKKSRRMIAEQARAFAAAGGLVLVADLSGTGDSEAEFADARVEHWKDDILVAWNWLSGQTRLPLWLWGIRFGGLLATQKIAELRPGPKGIVLWQPIVSGKTFMQQFLRLALAQQFGASQEDVERTDVKSILKSGVVTEVGGYDLHPDLVHAIEGLKMDDGAPGCDHTIWLECGPSEDANLSPGASRCVEKWRKAGAIVHAEKVTCPSFWASQDIEESARLIERTTALVCEAMIRE